MCKHPIKILVLELASIGAVSLYTADAWANPQDGQVVDGSATITQATPNKVDITQTTDKAIIDWNSFSINANEHTEFHQPSAGSVTLNRVVGEDPSQILGRLTANGQVFLVNPNGIYFGKNAQIDVAGLVASTHNIRNEDFLAGRYNFNIPGKPGAAVINEGTINIADTGIAAFVAPSAANRGVIVAKLGRVVLAAANGFTLDFHGDELLTFLVDDEVAKTAFDLQGKQLTSFVENAGRIEAQGGYVLLTAKAAENAIHSVINQSGTIEATTVGTHNGEIILNAGKGSLSVSGTLDASAPNGGDGGFIETSGGHVAIDPAMRITTAALFGKTGRWLIDPTDYTIAASGGDIIGAALANYLSASNVEIQTLATGSSGNGDIFVNDSVTWNTLNKLTLTAHRNIYVNEALNGTGGGSVKLRADSLGTGTGTVAFSGNGHVTVNNGAAVEIYYNPVSYTDAATKVDKYVFPFNPFWNFVTSDNNLMTAYMLVNSVNQLQAINTNLTGNYALSRDIDASDTVNWNGGAGFVPIVDFEGKFNGLGYTISDLAINRPASLFVGLFAQTRQYSLIQNVGLVGGSVVGDGYVGGLVGQGYGTVSSSYATGNVSGNHYVGGLVGFNGDTISNSYATGRVDGTGSNIGGLVGYNFGITISNSYATGNVSGNSEVGGLVGQNDSSDISNSNATGNVSGTNGYIGGLVGWNNSGTINNSYSTGSVSGTNFYSGGLVGYSSWGTVNNSYWDTETSGKATSSAGTGLTTAQMKQQASFSGWDFANTWQITEGVSRPTLKVASAQAVTVLKPSGSVTPPPPVTLTPAQQLLVQEHQNDNPSMLLIAIGNGLFSNSPSDPVWVGMYQNGSATQAQITANSLWPTYAIYKSATASKVLEGLTNGDIVYGGTIWTALGSSNQQNRNDAYYSFTHPTSPSTLTQAQQQLVDEHKNDTVTQMLMAIAAGLFTNSNTDPVWVALYKKGVATPDQVTVDRLRRSYDAYTAADIFNLIVSNNLHNDSTKAEWTIIYRNGHATKAQVDANAFANTYIKYKGATADTLFKGIVFSGDISPKPTASNAVVWQQLVKEGLSKTNKAAQMAEARDTYYAHSSKLLQAVMDEKIAANDGDNRWVALKDGWGSSTLSLSAVQRAVLNKRKEIADKAAADKVIVKAQDYGTQEPWGRGSNNHGSGGNLPETDSGDSTKCTLGAFICGGGNLGNGDGVDSGNGTSTTGAGSTTQTGTSIYQEAASLVSSYANNPADIQKVVGNVNYAVLANNAYHDAKEAILPNGFVEAERVTNNNLGFSATVFKDTNTGKVTIAFRGTSETDNHTQTVNYAQDVDLLYGGYRAQPIFAAALKYANDVRERIEKLRLTPGSEFYGVTSLDFTGHSLGGALATYAGFHTGGDVVTFNTAPLGQAQLDTISADSRSRLKIVNFRSTNDPLTTLDHSTIAGDMVNVSNAAGGHNMTSLMGSMNAVVRLAPVVQTL